MKKYDIKPLLAIAFILVGGIIGGTVAYFTTNASFENVFKTKPYATEIKETFESPDNWTPGTTTAKTVIAKNTGDVDIAVRVSYTEAWVSANNTALPLKQGNNTAAIINFANTSDWIKDGNYYYYNKKLSKNQSTSTFLDSVTFNKNITASTTCTTSDDGLVENCVSTGNGYDGATYTLTINVETIQYDAYQEVWTDNVTIS